MDKLLRILFFLLICSGVYAQDRPSKRLKDSSKSLKKSAPSAISKPADFVFGQADTSIRRLARKLAVSEQGNYESPLVVILLSDSISRVKPFHSATFGVENATKNSIRSLACKQIDGLARAILINSVQGLDAYLSSPAEPGMKVVAFAGFKELQNCKYPEFLKLDSKYHFRKIIPESNINIFPGENGPVQLAQPEDKIQY